MEGKSIILLVLASLAQSAYVPTLKVDYGLSKERAAVLHKIIVCQEDTLSTFLDIFEIVFGIILNPETEVDNLCHKLTDALHVMDRAVDIAVNLDVLILGQSCSAVAEASREVAHAKFKEVFLKRIKTAIKLAGFGNYKKNRAGIELQHSIAQKLYKDLVDIDFDVIVACLNTTDAKALAGIKSVQEEATIGVIYIINGIFNAIKIYAATVPTSCGDASVIFDIQDVKDKAVVSMKTYIEYKFSTIRALFINFCLNQYQVFFGVAQSQYAEIALFLRYMDANEDIFDVVTSYLKRIDLGLYDDDAGKAFSATNVSFAKVIAANDAGNGIILDFILLIHPDVSTRIATAKEYLHALNVKANIAAFDAFDVAVARDKTHSEIVGSIETLRKSVISIASDYVQYIFRLIRNNRTFDRKTEDELESLENVAFYGGKMKTLKIFDAALILAKASHAGVVDEEDYSAIEVLRDDANQALDGVTQGTTAAGLLVFRNMKAD